MQLQLVPSVNRVRNTPVDRMQVHLMTRGWVELRAVNDVMLFMQFHMFYFNSKR